MANKLSQRQWVIAIVITSAPILVYLYGAQFVRYMADDFCIGNTAWLNSMLAGQQNFPVAGFLDYGLHIAGQGIAPFFTVLFIIVWWIGTFLLLRALLHHTLMAMLGASLFVSATLASTTNMYQSIYWQVGMRENLTPFIAATYLVWLIVQRTMRQSVTLVLCFLFAFLSCGLNFVFGAALALISGVIWLVLRKQREINYRLLASVAGAGLVILLVLLSPSTSARFQEEVTNPYISANPQAVSRLLNGLQRGFKDPLIYTLRYGPVAWAALVILPFIVGQAGISGFDTSNFMAELAASRRKRIIVTLIAIGAPVLAIATCMLMWAGGYVSIGKMAVRLWLPGQFLLLVSTATAAYILGFAFAATFPTKLAVLRRFGIAIVAIVLVATALNVVVKGIPVIGQIRAYSVLADQRDAQLRAGVLTVAELPSFNLNDLGVPWFDQCLKTYYNLPALPVASR